MWRKTLAESVWFHAKATLAIMPVFVAGFDYVGCPQKVSGRSMQPTFNASATSNWVWLNKWRGLVRFERGATPGCEPCPTVAALYSPRDATIRVAMWSCSARRPSPGSC